MHAEDARLQRHFATVLRELAARDVAHLERRRRARRAGMIRALAAYAARARFPRNPAFARPTPYFVDAAETRCAMAHLVESTGERDLVEGVARDRNHAVVRELGELVPWLADVGLTVDEAARIQPSYCFIEKAECVCHTETGADDPPAMVEVTVSGPRVIDRIAVTIDVVYGAPANLAVGDTADLGTAVDLELGTKLLAYARQEHSIPRLGDGMTLDGDHVALPCNWGLALTKDQVIDAVLAGEACPDHLAQIDPAWKESQCDDGGCSAAGGSPMLALVVAALAARRPKRRAP